MIVDDQWVAKFREDPQEVLNDFQHFLDFIHKIILPAEPKSHTALAQFHIRLVYYACEQLSALAAPRGVTKSTIFAKYRALNRLVDPYKGTCPLKKVDFMLVSETSTLAKEHLEWVKWHLVNNQFLIEKYGNLTNPTKLTWNESEIELTNGNRAIAVGAGSQIRGRHPTDIICDDLESTANTNTEESLAKHKDWFYRVLMGCMIPETRLGVIGTIIRRDSLLSDLIISKKDFRGKIFRALTELPDGSMQSIWPDRWSVEYLLWRKSILGTHEFNAEYQNEPVGMRDAIVLHEWIRRHQAHDMAQMKVVRRYIACDPAFTEEKWGCYSAIVVMDELENGELWERYTWRRRVTLPQLVDTLIFVWHKYATSQPTMMGIEEVAAQKAVRQAVMEKDPTVGSKLLPLKADKNKRQRLIGVSRYFEFGLVSLQTEGMIDELTTFPHGDLDRVDALVYALRLYETMHPSGQVGKASELPQLASPMLDPTSKALFQSFALEGVPGYTMTREEKRAHFKEMHLRRQFEEMLDM